MRIDRGGNTFRQAKEFTFASSSISFKDQIGGRDSNDFFRFRLNHRSSVSFAVNSVSIGSSKASLRLLNAEGQQVQVGKPQGKHFSRISARLSAGSYCIRVSSSAKKSIAYGLRASVVLAKPDASHDGSLSTTVAIADLTDQRSTQTSSLTQTGLDDGSTIDIMIAYTSEARASEGSTAAINKTIQAAVDEVNQGYANSGIIQRLRLVHTAEVNYAESGDSNTELSRLQSKNDGYLDNIHTLRDQYGADVVSLFVKSSNLGGTSYLMNRVSPEFEAYAFSVVQLNNVKTRFSLGHELGHNFGAAHDQAHIDSGAAFAYAHGYITPSGVGDVMSYAQNRRNFYSSPNITVNGETLGKVGEADVVSAFNAVRFTAANWRKSIFV